jgi:hypothetical protein
LKHLLNFKELNESTSAFSQERAGWGYAPFQFAKNYDPRVGYSKEDFINDLNYLYKEMSIKKKKQFKDALFRYGGVLEIYQIKNLSNSKVEALIKDIEKFLTSDANKKMSILPDGFVLCYEKMENQKRKCDLYYSPYSNEMRISYTDTYPEMEDIFISKEEFKPEEFDLDLEDFNETIEKCKSFIKKDDTVKF